MTTHERTFFVGHGGMLFVRATGLSGNTMIMEAGAGDTSEGWRKLNTLLSAHHRTFAYDRAGAGKSTSTDNHCTFAGMARNLRMLVSSVAENDRVFLVAHSLGAAITQLVILDFPEVIIGHILVDPIPDPIFSGLRGLLTPRQFDLWLGLLESKQANPERWEIADLEKTLDDIRVSTPATPTLVLSSSNPSSVPEEWRSWWPSSAYASFCQRCYRDLSKRYRHFTHICLPDTNHYLHRDFPSRVYSEIRGWSHR